MHSLYTVFQCFDFFKNLLKIMKYIRGKETDFGMKRTNGGGKENGEMRMRQ
jgi:hypothetical protein